MRTYKQLRQEQRYYIFQLNKKDFTQDDIVKEVGVHKSTISRELIDEKLSEQQWSPEQISGWLLEEKSIAITHECIYQHIWVDKRQGGDLYQYLRCQGKKY
ncbi:MAG: helix-turn-helix domain-containing protein [Thiohalomonas sp.]|nr:helix-turn-helix domain-containing protein [Thiohalomonas sp.]